MMSRCYAGDKWPKSALRLVVSWCERWPLAGLVNDGLKEICFHNEKHCALMRSSAPLNLGRNPALGCSEMGGKSSGAQHHVPMSQKVLKLT